MKHLQNKYNKLYERLQNNKKFDINNIYSIGNPFEIKYGITFAFITSS